MGVKLVKPTRSIGSTLLREPDTIKYISALSDSRNDHIMKHHMKFSNDTESAIAVVVDDKEHAYPLLLLLLTMG